MTWPRLQALAGLLVLVGWLAGPRAAAQVLDDSTKVVYGPKTTRIIYEAEILRDSTSGTPLDTTLTRWPQNRFWFHDTTFQQDLGAVGTASRPLLYRPNLQLGARYGRNVFDKYARDATTVPYYDTRSPYSFFRVLQSGAGEQVFEFSYSRSLRKNFSVGVSYERIASNKILAARSSRDGLVEHSNLLFFSRFQTEDERYHLLFNFTNVRHRGIEQGGIWPVPPTDTAPGQTSPEDLFNYGRERVYLNNAVNNEDRDQVYFTQTYRLLGRGLTVYHTFDAKRQYNNYSDSELRRQENGALLFYPNTPPYNVNATIDRAEFRQVENTVGVLGRTNAVEYRLYARDRIAGLNTKRADSSTVVGNPIINLTQAASPRSFNQVFFGGTAAFNYRTIYAVETAGEVLAYSFGNPYPNFPEYWLRASVRTGPLSGELLRSSYSPTLTQQQFVGNHYQWNHLPGSDNDFDNTNTTQLTGRLRLKLPSLGRLTQQRFEASVSGVNISNLVYYGTDAKPVQETETARNLLIGRARHQVRFGRVNFDNEATYTRGGDVDGIRIPALVTNTRVYYESYIFRKALFSQVGAEMYYQSRYRAFNYSPSTQQFYQQNTFTIRNYPVVDVFFSADIKAVTVFLKVAYVNQGIMGDGYFTTPYYTGYPRRFQLGLRWDFFN
ncbi:putative porin [Hymenobacter sp. B1770]|uniref:putative porin n=1 Tax=Hymenobacter sp. B1770 TaxID=1718788 RepID=UPI003CF48638